LEVLFTEKRWAMLLQACRNTHERRFLGEPQRLCYLHAVAARNDFQLDEALAMICQTLKITAGSIDARVERAEIFVAMGDHEAAAQEWCELHRLHRAEVPIAVFKQLVDYLFRARKMDSLYRVVQHEVAWNRHCAVVQDPEMYEALLQYAKSLPDESEKTSHFLPMRKFDLPIVNQAPTVIQVKALATQN